MRSPLEAIKEGSMEGELSRVNTVDWVANLRETFTRLYSQASRREGKYKERTKLKYDKKTKPRAFAPGDMVLIHNPTSSGKLNSIWDAPYEVKGRLSNTLYWVAIPRSKSKSEKVHINRLKLWRTCLGWQLGRTVKVVRNHLGGYC